MSRLAEDRIFSSGRIAVVLAIITHYRPLWLLLRALRLSPDEAQHRQATLEAM